MQKSAEKCRKVQKSAEKCRKVQKRKELICLSVLILILCIAAFNRAVVAYAAYYDEGNNGDSWETAYVIDSVEDFMLMRERVGSYRKIERGKYYKITADLDVSAEAGMSTNASFYGHLDGQNHTLKINIQNDNNTGSAIFFSVSADQVAIRNLNVSGSCKGGQVAGILHGLYSGIVENCSFTGTLEGEIVGGIACAIDNNASVKNCIFSGEIIASGTTATAGGIIGQLRGGNIDNCTISSGTVITCNPANEQTIGFVGGIAGMTSSLSVAPSITNCTSYAVLEGNVKDKGGIVGAANNLYSPALILSGNTWPKQYPEVGYTFGISIPGNGNITPTPSPSPVTSPDTPAELEIAIISPVPDLSPDVIARLAQNISVDTSEIILLTSSDFTTSDPPEPTQAMWQEVASQNGKFIAKLNTINVSKDGWYVFMVTVSDDIVGTSISDLRLFGAEDSDFAASFKASFGFLSLFNGITGMYEVSNLFGLKLDTLEKQVLVTMLLSAGKSLTTYFVKILLMLLAGCNSAGIGIGAVFVIAGIIAVKFFRKKR